IDTFAIDPKLAKFGTDLLVGWKKVVAGQSGYSAQFAVVGTDGTIKVKPGSLSGASFHRPDDWVTLPSGEVAWATGSAEGITLHRMKP
ncbi:MAG: hypothetical protein Q4G39_09820, partial [Brachymonas sp.]|nr:hypothetical protein [Brachymonas sp.]